MMDFAMAALHYDGPSRRRAVTLLNERSIWAVKIEVSTLIFLTPKMSTVGLTEKVRRWRAMHRHSPSIQVAGVWWWRRPTVRSLRQQQRALDATLCMATWRTMFRDSRKSQQKMAKNTADFCENRKNHGKDMTSNYGPKDHDTVYKIQHPALSTIITCSARFLSVKFCHCGTLTNSRKR